MGSSIVKQTRRQLNSDHLNWTILACTSYCVKVQDKIVGIVGQKYTVDEELVEKEWKLYLLRHNNPQYLVTIYDILSQNASTICTTSKQLGIVSEHIPYRLADLGAIEYQQAIYILSTIMKGYKLLKENNVDFYLLDQNNICFNKKGKCKIWINQNLYLARPSPDRRVTQKQFIQSAYQLLQDRVTQKKGIFLKKLKNTNHLTLDYMLGEIQGSAKNRLLCMQSLNNINNQTSRSKDIGFQIQKSFNKILSPKKQVMSPTRSLKKRADQDSLYIVSTTSKKLSLANRKKQPSSGESKSANNVRSGAVSPKNVISQIVKGTTYHSAVFTEGPRHKKNETGNYSQIFSKKKVYSRESMGGEASFIPNMLNPSFKKLKFTYNNSAHKL